MLADVAGRHWLVGGPAASRYGVPQHLRWSDDGRWLAWITSDGELYLFDARRAVVRAWPCPCGGLAFDGDRLWTTESDGSAVVAVDPVGGPTARTELSGLRHSEYPEVLAAEGGKLLIGTAVEGRTGVSGGPTHFFMVASDGRARTVGVDRANSQVATVEPEPNGHTVAYVSDAASGVCDDFESVALLDPRSGRIAYPAMPASTRPWSIAWLRWTTDGLKALFEHDPECARAGAPPSGHHPSDLGLWTLTGDLWRRVNGTALVSESELGMTATITPTAGPNVFPLEGALRLSSVWGAKTRSCGGSGRFGAV
jgi:hypothetical protein